MSIVYSTDLQKSLQDLLDQYPDFRCVPDGPPNDKADMPFRVSGSLVQVPPDHLTFHFSTWLCKKIGISVVRGNQPDPKEIQNVKTLWGIQPVAGRLCAKVRDRTDGRDPDTVSNPSGLDGPCQSR